jgi:uncharacterized membrane protein
MDKIRAQSIDERSKLDYTRLRFREWVLDSLLFYPLLFMLAAILLVIITRNADKYLLLQENVPEWWYSSASSAVTISSLVASSMLAFLAIVFSISLVALQLANQQYSPRVISIFERSPTTKIALSLFIGTFVFSFIFLTFVLRTHYEKITIISLLTAVILVFACLIIFIVFMKSIMMMIRVTYTISIIADETRRAIDENLPTEKAYIECQIEPFDVPDQVVRYTHPPRYLFSKRYEHGVLKALERSTLVQLARKHECVIRVLPRNGDYVNQDDPVVEVYGENTLKAEDVLKAIYVDPERTVYQDPAYGIRMLVDIALQALSKGVNAPTTAHQVISRLTNLLHIIAQKPEHTGAYTDDSHRVRLMQPIHTWEDYIRLTFTEIQYYGKDDPQTRKSLGSALDYLLEKIPEEYKPPIERQKALLTGNSDYE